jgi:hypothetical protein
MILSYQLPFTQLGYYLISRTLLPKISYVSSISIIITRGSHLRSQWEPSHGQQSQ